MSYERIDTSFKILILGAPNVGKSSLLLRFTQDKFTNQSLHTLGVDINTKNLEIDGRCVRLRLWDTAGTEKFRAIVPAFYRGSQAAILVYDVTSQHSLLQLDHWLNELEIYGTRNQMVKMIMGNKIDLENRVVDTNEGQEFAEKHKALYIETSAKTGYAVDIAFEEVARKILLTPGLWEFNHKSAPRLKSKKDEKSERKTFKC